MVVDIYTRTPDEVNYSINTLDVGNELQIHLQQILMVLKTNRGVVLGDTNFGFNLEALVFDENLKESDIEQQINVQLNNYCLYMDMFATKSKVSFYKGPTSDYCLVDIIIDGEKYLGVLVS